MDNSNMANDEIDLEVSNEKKLTIDDLSEEIIDYALSMLPGRI